MAGMGFALDLCGKLSKRGIFWGNKRWKINFGSYEDRKSPSIFPFDTSTTRTIKGQSVKKNLRTIVRAYVRTVRGTIRDEVAQVGSLGSFVRYGMMSVSVAVAVLHPLSNTQ